MRSKCFAFVYFSTVDGAIKAKEEMQGTTLHGRQIRVDFSTTKKAHSPTPGQYLGKSSRRYNDRGYGGGGGYRSYGGGGGGYRRSPPRRDYYDRYDRGGDRYDRYSSGGGGGGGYDRYDRGGGGGGGYDRGAPSSYDSYDRRYRFVHFISSHIT